MTRRLLSHPLRSSLGLVAAAAAGLALLPAGAAVASTPVLTGPDTTWSTSITVADPHVQASCAADPADVLPVVEVACPVFPIVLDAIDDRPLHFLDVRLEMAPVGAGRTIEDYDIYLYDATGAEVDSSANAVGATELITRNLIPDGEYTVKVVPYTNRPNSTVSLSVRYRTTTS